MLKFRLWAVFIFIFGASVGWFVWSAQFGNIHRPFRLGLDLSGGTHLEYKADTSRLAASDISDSMAALRDTIERRVNIFGVAEPLVQTEKSSFVAGGNEQRLIIELPGVTNTQAAIQLIGQTPVLDFRVLKTGTVNASTTIGDFEPTALTGRFVTRADLQFSGGGRATAGLPSEPEVSLTFNAEGSKLFEQITKDNVGKVVGIFLDGQPISTPVVREAISGGQAVISGGFSAEQAKDLARNLNYGALPVPIELISTETVGATLGATAVNRGLNAGLWGILAVMLFMVVWYRLPGIIASLALLLYVLMTLALFQIIPVTLTAAGIAGFILSVGMAVDANVLIFERMKEELRAGKNAQDAVTDGFSRAWNSIRDSNTSSIITAVILFWFGTSLIKGFALVFGLGVLVSMLTAISISRTLLMALGVQSRGAMTKFLFGSGSSISL